MEAFIDAIKSLCQWQLSTTWPDNLPSPACLPLCFLFKPVGYFLLSSGSIARRQEVPSRRIHTLLCSTPARLPSFPAPCLGGLPPPSAGYLSSRQYGTSLTPRSPRCATCCAVPKSVEQSSRFHLLRNRRPDLPTAFSLSPQSLDIVLGLSGWQKSRLSALIRLSSTGSRYRRTTTLPSVFPPWFSCSQHAASRSVCVCHASPLVSASTLTSGLLCSLQAVWLPDLSPSTDRCPTASHIAVVAVSTSFSQ